MPKEAKLAETSVPATGVESGPTHAAKKPAQHKVIAASFFIAVLSTLLVDDAAH